MVQIDNTTVEIAASILRAISHPTRLRIIAFIDENKKINVNKIYGSLKLEQSITSQHLRILRDNEIVKTSREGKFIIYSLNYNKIGNSIQAVNLFLSKNHKGTNGAM